MLDQHQIKALEALPEGETVERIKLLKKQYGKDLCLLAHLYQRKKITDLANVVGDSFGLSKAASEWDGGKYIVFAGVRFMAESAAILAREDQIVLHPDPEAGCPMADMASLEQVQFAWDALELEGVGIPVTYMNSTADIKAFCGKKNGTICTSSNATNTFNWAFTNYKKIFFLPDEHLGRNTALKYGIPEDCIAVWDPEKKELEGADISIAKAILWRGYCPVHKKFTARDIEHVRNFYPKALVVVHPECPKEVAEKADAVGSTDFIRKYVAGQRPGTQIFIGTEINLIQNLAQDHPDKMVSKLHRSLCLTMYQITMGKLLYTLENLKTLEPVQLSEEVKHFSKLALNRMLSLVG